jgi:phage N-6-adenine-methyltransferase
MSLVGFKSRNHPQQVGRNGARSIVDLRATPLELFDPLNERFGFTLDVCAEPHNAKCERYFTPEKDGLAQHWDGRVWCNPPYSDIEPWVAKAKNALYAELVVMLVPANRCEQGWWQRHVEPCRDGRLPFGPRVEFLAGRQRFINPGEDTIKPNARPPFGCALLIFGDMKSPTASGKDAGTPGAMT